MYVSSLIATVSTLTLCRWVMQVLLPTYVHALISERRGGHLGQMRQQGLTPTAYYTATYLWALVVYVLFTIVFVGVGAAIGLSIFTKTAVGVQVSICRIVIGHAGLPLAKLLQ